MQGNGSLFFEMREAEYYASREYLTSIQYQHDQEYRITPGPTSPKEGTETPSSPIHQRPIHDSGKEVCFPEADEGSGGDHRKGVAA